MKKMLSLLIAFCTLLLATMASAMAEEQYSLNELFELMEEESCYPSGLLWTNCVVTESAQFRVDVGVDNTRVDYHLLTEGEWVYDAERGIVVNQTVFDSLIKNPDEPSGEYQKRVGGWESLKYEEAGWISLASLSRKLFDARYYSAGMLDVNITFTEACSVLLEVEVDAKRVDYHLLSPEQWRFDDTYGVLIHEDAVRELVNNPNAPSGRP